MNVKKAIEKVNEWITVGNNFKKSLPANDEVLAMWLDQLEEFSQDLPFLLQLSSDALKVLDKCCTYCTYSQARSDL